MGRKKLFLLFTVLVVCMVYITIMMLTKRSQYDLHPAAEIVRQEQGRQVQKMPTKEEEEKGKHAEEEKAEPQDVNESKKEEEKEEENKAEEKEDEKRQEKRRNEEDENKTNEKEKDKRDENDAKEEDDKPEIPNIKARLEEEYRGPKGGLRERLADTDLVISPVKNVLPVD